jgi:integrase/recombinase XerD
MLLSVFTRHSAGCKCSRDRVCRRCNCPKWVGSQVNGYYFRQSARTRQWAEAEEVRVMLEEVRVKGLPSFGTAGAAGLAPPIPTQADPPPASPTEVPRPRVPKPRPRVTVAPAVDAYLADAVSRSVESSTLKKLETIFRKRFLAWTRVERFEYFSETN